MLILLAVFLLTSCVRFKPINININVKIEHEIKIKVDRQVEGLLKNNSDLFG
ncbi:MAG TPA: YnbE family lipoprotein [Arsenophonus sp.]